MLNSIGIYLHERSRRERSRLRPHSYWQWKNSLRGYSPTSLERWHPQQRDWKKCPWSLSRLGNRQLGGYHLNSCFWSHEIFEWHCLGLAVHVPEGPCQNLAMSLRRHDLSLSTTTCDGRRVTRTVTADNKSFVRARGRLLEGRLHDVGVVIQSHAIRELQEVCVSIAAVLFWSWSSHTCHL